MQLNTLLSDLRIAINFTAIIGAINYTAPIDKQNTLHLDPKKTTLYSAVQ